MSHIEYYDPYQSESVDSKTQQSVAELEVALTSFMLLVYGESPDLDSTLSIDDRILNVAKIIEGLG
jgi:hypothetical protein